MAHDDKIVIVAYLMKGKPVDASYDEIEHAGYLILDKPDCLPEEDEIAFMKWTGRTAGDVIKDIYPELEERTTMFRSYKVLDKSDPDMIAACRDEYERFMESVNETRSFMESGREALATARANMDETRALIDRITAAQARRKGSR